MKNQIHPSRISTAKVKGSLEQTSLFIPSNESDIVCHIVGDASMRFAIGYHQPISTKKGGRV